MAFGSEDWTLSWSLAIASLLRGGLLVTAIAPAQIQPKKLAINSSPAV